MKWIEKTLENAALAPYKCMYAAFVLNFSIEYGNLRVFWMHYACNEWQISISGIQQTAEKVCDLQKHIIQGKINWKKFTPS